MYKNQLKFPKLKFICVTETSICNDHKWSGPCLVFNLPLQQDSYADNTLDNWLVQH